MKLSVNQERLRAALAIVGRAVNSRSTLPVLGNVLLRTGNDVLEVAATNLELGIVVWIKATIEEPGSITIPARLLTEFVNSLPPDTINMTLAEKSLTLKLTCRRYDANIKGIDADEFPMIAKPLDVEPIELSPATLKSMIEQTAFAAATDESRPTLTGIKTDFASGTLTMAATDRYRLSVRTEQIESDAELHAIIPAKSLAEVARVLGESDTVGLQSDGATMRFSCEGTERADWLECIVVTSLIDARFPDYTAIIPKTNLTETVVETAALLRALRVAKLFARDNSNIVHLDISGNGDGSGNVKLLATSTEMGDNVSEVAAEVNGKEINIAFNAEYLIALLTQVEQPRVSLATTESNRPGLFKPVGSTNFFHVTMPMHSPR